MQNCKHAHQQTTSLINECFVGAAISVAKDGGAPESGQDGPLREQLYEQGTAYTNRSIYLALLRAIVQAYRTSRQVFIRR